MKAIRWIFAVASLALTMPAQGAITDPEVILYRFSGVRDNGGSADTGTASVFHCTNFSGVGELIRIVVRNDAGGLVFNNTVGIAHPFTVLLPTHAVAAYTETTFMNTGTLAQGTAAIAATSPNILCGGMTIDAAVASPAGVPLPTVRFNPIPGSQE